MSKVTVVIPNYNGKKYLKPCMDSLMAQSFADFSVIVVDNASTDGGMDVLSEWMTEKGSKEWAAGADTNGIPRLTCIQLNENTGFSHAVNVGIRRAKSEYVFLLNNDTTVHRDCLLELVRFMDAHKNAFCAGAKMLMMSSPEYIDDCGDYYNALGYAYAAGKGRKSADYRAVREVFSACAGAALYRTRMFCGIGLFDENHFAYLEDVDIGYRARIKGLSNYIVPSAIVFHAGSAVSGSRHNAFKVRLASKNSMYVIYKNQPLLQWLLNLPFIFVGVLVKFLYFCKKGLGGVYFRGVIAGIRFCFTKEAGRHRVRFQLKNMRYYIRIQWELWRNLLYAHGTGREEKLQSM
ncbi:MAG: glycosyltransferase family 2 protein [Clostridium sp.]|nr:glycosyltransferase family 2 protein [Clostridium sp.]